MQCLNRQWPEGTRYVYKNKTALYDSFFYFKYIQIETFPPKYTSVESLNQTLSSSHANNRNQKNGLLLTEKIR